MQYDVLLLALAVWKTFPSVLFQFVSPKAQLTLRSIDS